MVLHRILENSLFFKLIRDLVTFNVANVQVANTLTHLKLSLI